MHTLEDLYNERDRLKKMTAMHKARYDDYETRAAKALAKAIQAAQLQNAVEQAIRDKLDAHRNGPDRIRYGVDGDTVITAHEHGGIIWIDEAQETES